jgi:hypothetical protein
MKANRSLTTQLLQSIGIVRDVFALVTAGSWMNERRALRPSSLRHWFTTQLFSHATSLRHYSPTEHSRYSLIRTSGVNQPDDSRAMQ